jgi:uncharacterized membrane protein
MLNTKEFWTLTALAAVAVLVLTNMVLFGQNRQAQAEINGRAQYIQQTVQVEPLYRELVKALADLSVRNNDGELRDMLAKQGITLSSNANPSPSDAPADSKKGGQVR